VAQHGICRSTIMHERSWERRSEKERQEPARERIREMVSKGGQGAARHGADSFNVQLGVIDMAISNGRSPCRGVFKSNSQ